MKVLELALVLGLPSAVVERLLPYITVYSGRPEINIHDAGPVVIAALPGMTPERLGAVLSDRELLLEQSSSAGFAAARAETTLESSKAVRVTVRMAFESGRATTSESVILVDGHAEPYRVLSWRNDADAEPAVHSATTDAGEQP